MPKKKCKVCGKNEMLNFGRCCWCGFPPGYPLSKEWKELQKKLLPKQRARDRKCKKWARDFEKRLRAFKKSIKPKIRIDM
jgi:hypothetical protein